MDMVIVPEENSKVSWIYAVWTINVCHLWNHAATVAKTMDLNLNQSVGINPLRVMNVSKNFCCKPSSSFSRDVSV